MVRPISLGAPSLTTERNTLTPLSGYRLDRRLVCFNPIGRIKGTSLKIVLKKDTVSVETSPTLK